MLQWIGTLEERQAEYQKWCVEVRDPAKVANEGLRRIATKKRGAYAEYDIAALSLGKWAMRHRISYECGNYSGSSTPWDEYGSREECVEVFLNQARQFFERETETQQQEAAREEMLKLLTGDGLFGWQEPPPR